MIPLQRVVLVDNDYVQGLHADEHALEVERAGPRLRAPRQPQGGVRAESWSGRNPRAASARPKTAQLSIDSAVVAGLFEENSIS